MKKALLFALIISICIFASACSSKSSSDSEPDTTEAVIETTNDAAAETTLNENEVTADWKALYTDYINDPETGSSYADYALLFIDYDSVPELLIKNGSKLTLAWVSGGEIKSKRIGDVSDCDFGYTENSGSFWVLEAYTGAHGPVHSLYSFQSNNLSLEHEARYYYTSKLTYTVDNKEVDESEYNNMVSIITSYRNQKPDYQSKYDILDELK